jgi:hypothetical protein
VGGNRRRWIRPKSQEEGDDARDGGNLQEKELQEMKEEPVNDVIYEASDDTTTASRSQHFIMRKHGRNQLILSNQKHPSASSEIKESPDIEFTASAAAGQAVMLREGRNKLVAVKAAVGSRKKHLAPSGNIKKKTKHFGPSVAERRLRSKRSAPKRIKLSVRADQANPYDGPETGESGDDSDSEQNLEQNSGTGEVSEAHFTEAAKGEKESDVTEKLTDFAYRETSRVRKRTTVSQNLHWSKNMKVSTSEEAKDTYEKPNARNRSMGLVRVQPNEKKTPICPTFLRGLQCKNQFCRKRHDVPRDFAMPVCSFFQRHGQCLRGDECVFRHVKVNPRAMVCPSFSLLGFCEDEFCAMQHVRGSSKARQR